MCQVKECISQYIPRMSTRDGEAKPTKLNRMRALARSKSSQRGFTSSPSENMVLQKSKKKKKTSRKERRTQSNHPGYDSDIHSNPNHNTSFSETLWWEPIDDGATTTEVPISQRNRTPSGQYLSTLDVHTHFWNEDVISSNQDGKPKGFLEYSDAADGKPKGFLTFLEEEMPAKPTGRPLLINPNLLNSSRYRSIITFLVNNRNRVRKVNPSSAFFVDDIFDSDGEKEKPDRLGLWGRLGGVLPDHSLPPLDPGLAKSNLKLPTLPVIPMKEDIIDEKTLIRNTEEENNLKTSYPPLPSNVEEKQEIIPPSTPFPLRSHGRDWNEEFQYLMETLFDNEESIAKMRLLAKNFAKLANDIGTIIISELFIDPEYRTIPSVTDIVGGVAGGEKYVYEPEGIFFKFAVDDKGIYGGTEFIMKSAGQELKSLLELMDCRVQGISFPLMVLVDYRGYRLIAMPLLPVGPDTLVYGSSDGGATIFTISSEMNVRMQLIGSILNLAGHDVWNLDHTEKTTLFPPVDIEGHLGYDSRFYILDTARLFPPSIPIAGLRGCHLYRLLRPEFVKNNPTPLCSDAYSTWEVEGIVSYNRDVAEATHRLETEVIPMFASKIQNWLLDEDGELDLCVKQNYTDFKAVLHRAGINLRCSGLVRQYTHEEEIRKFILIEIAARVAKKILFGRMRKLRTSEDFEYLGLITDYCNLLFNHTQESSLYWSVTIKNSLLKRFCNALTVEERDPSYDLRSSLSMVALYLRVQDLCGFEFGESAEDAVIEFDELLEDQVGYFDQPLFFIEDIESFYARERSIHQIDFAEGTILSRRAASAEQDDAEELFALADQRFQATIERKPDDFRALHNWALSLLHRANKRDVNDGAFDLYNQAYKYVEQAISLNCGDSNAHLLWGNILSEHALRYHTPDKANHYFLQACAKYNMCYECSSEFSFELFYNWGNALLYLAKRSEDVVACKKYLIDATLKYERAISLSQGSMVAQRNWGVVLCKLARLEHDYGAAKKLFYEAESKFAICISHGDSSDSSDSEVYFNWGNVHYQCAASAAAAECFPDACQQLVFAGEKYMAAIGNGTSSSHCDALVNWGKVLNLLLHLNSNDLPPNYSLALSVELYLAIFTSFIVEEEYTKLLSFTPISGLAKAKEKSISNQALSCLTFLAKYPFSDFIRDDVQGALRVAYQSRAEEGQDPASVEICHDNYVMTRHPSIGSMLQKIEASKATPLFQNKALNLPLLSDFKALSEIGSTNSCKVYRKGTSNLYELKIRMINSIPPINGLRMEEAKPLVESHPIGSGDSTHHKIMSMVHGNIPFLASILYSYRKGSVYYFIQEHIPEERSLSKLRQSKRFRSQSQVLTRTHSIHLSSGGKGSRTGHLEKHPGRRMMQKKPHSFVLPGTACANDSLRFRREKLSEADARFYIAEIVILIGFLHSLDFVYGNLTPSTIHLDTEGHVCLSKFSFFLSGEAFLEDPITTSAPEVLCGGPYNKEADWWAVGKILHEFLTPEIQSDSLEQLSGSAQSFVRKLLRNDPSKRLGAKGVEEIKKHRFWEDFDWEKAELCTLPPPFQFQCDRERDRLQNTDMDSSEDGIIFKAPTMLAPLVKSNFHQHSMVEAPDYVEAEPLH